MEKRKLKSKALFWYEQWYAEKVSPNLSFEEKRDLAKKISDESLKQPIYEAGIYYNVIDFPELKHLTSVDKISGMQLYVVFTEIMKEFGANVISASEVGL